jgi:hypothetical protein
MAIGAKWRCPDCGVALENGETVCDCSGGNPADPFWAAGAESVPATSTSTRQAVIASRTPSDSVGRRYSDAYAIARTVISLGGVVKILAYVIGGLIALAGIVAAAQTNASLGSGTAAAGLIGGATAGVPIFVLGVLVSAVGQILRATLDTAVNTSPLLSQDDVRKIMSVV